MLEVPLNATALSGMVARRQAVGLPVLVTGGVGPGMDGVEGNGRGAGNHVRRSIMRARREKGICELRNVTLWCFDAKS